MQLDPTLPWDTLFARCLQSWRDSAARQAGCRFYSYPCERCPSDPYLIVACGHEWPHWQQHSLGDLMIELRYQLIDHHLDHRRDGVPLREHLWGWNRRSVSERPAEGVAAIADVDDFVQFVDLWLRFRLSDLGPWPMRVCQAAATSPR